MFWRDCFALLARTDGFCVSPIYFIPPCFFPWPVYVTCFENSALLTFGSLLALAGAAAPAQTAPAAMLVPDHYYLNGQPSTKAAVDALDPKTIASVDVLQGKQAADYTHDPHSKGVVLVTTK